MRVGTSTLDAHWPNSQLWNGSELLSEEQGRWQLLQGLVVGLGEGLCTGLARSMLSGQCALEPVVPVSMHSGAGTGWGLGATRDKMERLWV